ncbi:hypothetical protein EKK58_08790 [Candidatus Dependentiae bacterium]|nr:MAG: hypothetical protein EKK58_08790 [Candidatus Dependentiae bacterium]
MTHEATIGGRQVLLDTRWLLPENEEILVTFKDKEGGEISLKIEVVNEKSEKEEKPSLRIREENDTPIISFINWNSTFGNSTSKPINFASTDDNRIELSFLANITKLGPIYRVEFQVMSKELKNEAH